MSTLSLEYPIRVLVDGKVVSWAGMVILDMSFTPGGSPSGGVRYDFWSVKLSGVMFYGNITRMKSSEGTIALKGALEVEGFDELLFSEKELVFSAEDQSLHKWHASVPGKGEPPAPLRHYVEAFYNPEPPALDSFDRTREALRHLNEVRRHASALSGSSIDHALLEGIRQETVTLANELKTLARPGADQQESSKSRVTIAFGRFKEYGKELLSIGGKTAEIMALIEVIYKLIKFFQ